MTVKLFLAAAMMAMAGLASAQAPGDARGTVPPGTAADGSRPAEGAIKGGAILPGESSGVPGKSVLPTERIKRCYELSGTLREECLREAQDASGGSSSTRLPGTDGTKGIAPPDAPPPQNPR